MMMLGFPPQSRRHGMESVENEELVETTRRSRSESDEGDKVDGRSGVKGTGSPKQELTNGSHTLST